MMPKNDLAIVHLKASPGLRNRVLGKLRTRGITMQGFFETVMYLVDTDDRFLEMIEKERETFAKKPDAS